MVVRIYKVKYELAMELDSLEAEKLQSFAEEHFCVPDEDSPQPRYYVSEDFADELDENEKEPHKDTIERLKPLQGEEIVISW